MKKIKTTLIHWLGGYTKRDVNDISDARIADKFKVMKWYTEQLNGMDADAWCKSVYKYVCDMIKYMEHNE